MKLRLLTVAAAMMLTSMVTVNAQDTASEKGKLSYAIGYEIGRDINRRKIDVDLSTVIKAIQDGVAERDPAVNQADMEAALKAMQEKAMAQARAEFERVSGENKARSDRFLAENRGKSGVQVLPNGIQYRVIEAGNGAQPSASNEVQIHLRGSLTSGQEFASTYAAQGGQEPQPISVIVKDAPVAGLQEVLPMMKTGSRWEIFLPPEKAYGNDPRSPIGPNQAVIFDVRLVSVK